MVSEPELARLLKRAGEKITLPGKAELRERIWRSIQAEAVRSGSFPSLYAKRYTLTPVRMPIVALIAALVLAGGGMTVAAADKAIPGDPLYGLDQAIEKLQARLTSSPNLPAFAVARAEERLKEMGKLKEKIAQAKADGDFTEEERLEIWREKLAERLGQQIENANEQIERFRELLEKSDDPKLEARLTTMIARLESLIESREALKEKAESGELGKEEMLEMMQDHREKLLEKKRELQEQFKATKQKIMDETEMPVIDGRRERLKEIEEEQRRKGGWWILPAFPEDAGIKPSSLPLSPGENEGSGS